MAQPDVTKPKPIGYRLKHADEVTTEHVDRVLSESGFTRSRWQVLNIIYQAGTTTRSGVFDTTQASIDIRQLNESIEGFIEAGWLVKRGEGDGAHLTLTAAGKATRETVFELQSEVRRRAVKGTTEREVRDGHRRARAHGKQPGTRQGTLAGTLRWAGSGLSAPRYYRYCGRFPKPPQPLETTHTLSQGSAPF
jgi:DNA-binding MarR family transcriptional regulator